MAKPTTPTTQTTNPRATESRGDGRTESRIDGRSESHGDSHGRQIQRPERPQQGQGASTRMEGTSETAILRTCMDTITETFNYCIEEGGEHVEANHLRSMLDCWDVLHASCSLTARNSDYAQEIREICGRAVKACEESCETFDSDERMTACADTCRQAYGYLTGETPSGSPGNPKPNKGGPGEGEEE